MEVPNTVGSFFGIGEYYEGEPIELQLPAVLGFDPSDLTARGQSLLNEPSRSALGQGVGELTRAIRAYSQFQDLMESEVTLDPFEGRHYCFYESLVYTREAALALLNGQILAALTLARPLLELAVFHLYWRSRGRGDTYEAFYNWLGEDGGKPPFKNALDAVFQSLDVDSFIDAADLATLKSDFTAAYEDSCSYNHSPRPKESVVAVNGGVGPASPTSIAFAIQSLNDRLRLIVRLFIFAHPMSLFPVDMHRKWGYLGPVGLFWRDTSYRIVRQYIGEDACSAMRGALQHHPDVVTKLEWFGNHPDLSSDAIEDSWKHVAQGDAEILAITEHERRAAAAQAQLRAIEWLFSYATPFSITVPNEPRTGE